jgi:hypothetical protein
MRSADSRFEEEHGDGRPEGLHYFSANMAVDVTAAAWIDKSPASGDAVAVRFR